jgi:hypothetical protein
MSGQGNRSGHDFLFSSGTVIHHDFLTTGHPDDMLSNIMSDVIIGTPIYRQGAYVLDKFLKNQKQIQQSDPSSELLLATCEPDLIKELENSMASHALRGTVISYEVAKPDYAKSRVWNITRGREAIRQHMLSQTESHYLLFLDADMTFDQAVIEIMKREIKGYDAVFSGYSLQHFGKGLAGLGCALLTRSTLEKINFRCHEFKNGEVIFEDNVLEMDLFRAGSRVKKGFFLAIDHYTSGGETGHITPQPVAMFRKMANWAPARYALLRASILIRRNIPWKLKIYISKLQGRMPGGRRV